MYLIAKGECRAIVYDEQNEDKWDDVDVEEDIKEAKPKSNLKCWEVEAELDNENVSLLRPGHYFGEIAVVFNCERTAEVVATKYCTLATLTKPVYKHLLNQMPGLK